MSSIKQLFHSFSREDKIGQIHEHQLVIRTSGNNLDTALHQAVAERLRIVHTPLLVKLDIIAYSFLDAYCLGGDAMHKRATRG